MLEEIRGAGFQNWTAEQVEFARRWVERWEEAHSELERVRRKELRELDGLKAVTLLCGPADYRRSPRAPGPHSGLVEQQAWFQKARKHD